MHLLRPIWPSTPRPIGHIGYTLNPSSILCPLILVMTLCRNERKRGKWSEDTLKKAVEAVSSKDMSTYKAAEQFEIPRRIRRYIL